MHSPIVVTAEMETALIVSDPVHLDALLLAARERRDGPESYGRPLTAVARRDGFYQASASFFVADGPFGLGEGEQTRLWGLRRPQMHPGVFEHAHREAAAFTGPMAPYRNRLRTYRTRTGASLLKWLAVGDADEVLALVNEIGAIGAGHRTGTGAVRKWSVEAAAGGDDAFGLAHEGRPLRNLPIEIAHDVGIEVRYSGLGRIEPRYGAHDDRIEIVEPTLEQMVVTSDQMEDAIG